LSVPLPRAFVPSRNVTIPVACGLPEAPVTVAVRVRLAPRTLVAGAVRRVVVAVTEDPPTMRDARALVSPGLVTEIE
jgi:hypothetical protein